MIWQYSCIFMAKWLRRGILPCKGAVERAARSRIVWIHLVINQTLGEKDREEKLRRNNSTKIDNPIFWVLHHSTMDGHERPYCQSWCLESYSSYYLKY